MTFKGHVENGTIVLDGPVSLPDGTTVMVELAAELSSASKEASGSDDPTSVRFPLRGLSYYYKAPFEPAVVEGEWTACL